MRTLAAIVLVAGCGRIDFGNGDGAGNAAACSAVTLVDLRLGTTSTIGVAADGTFWGMGQNAMYELTLLGSNYDVPTQLPDLTGMTSVELGYYVGTAIGPGGELETWGAPSRSPRTHSAATDWSDPTVGWAFGCAKRSDDSLWCWGDNYQGNLGDGTNTDSDAPILVPLPAIASYSLGAYSACAIDLTGALWCWGQNDMGQAGVGGGATQLQPTQVGTDVDWAQISVGGVSTCARKVDDTLWCWGESYLDGTTNAYDTPTQLGTRTDWIDIETGFEHACALASDQTVWCFGHNMYGGLGVGPVDYRVPPTLVTLAGPADKLVVGGENTCASIGGAWWCWGLNEDGELGNGSFDDLTLPVARCP